MLQTALSQISEVAGVLLQCLQLRQLQLRLDLGQDLSSAKQWAGRLAQRARAHEPLHNGGTENVAASM